FHVASIVLPPVATSALPFSPSSRRLGTIAPPWAFHPESYGVTVRTTTFTAESRSPASLTASAEPSERNHVLDFSCHVHAGRPWPMRSETDFAGSPALAAVALAASSANTNCSAGGVVRLLLACLSRSWAEEYTLCGADRAEER